MVFHNGETVLTLPLLCGHNQEKLDLLKPAPLSGILLGAGQMLVPLNGCS